MKIIRRVTRTARTKTANIRFLLLVIGFTSIVSLESWSEFSACAILCLDISSCFTRAFSASSNFSFASITFSWIIFISLCFSESWECRALIVSWHCSILSWSSITLFRDEGSPFGVYRPSSTFRFFSLCRHPSCSR